jgi:hypothetical protein
MTESIKKVPGVIKDIIALCVGGISVGIFIAATAIDKIWLPAIGFGLAVLALVIKMANRSSSESTPTGEGEKRPTSDTPQNSQSASSDAQKQEIGTTTTAKTDDRAVA